MEAAAKTTTQAITIPAIASTDRPLEFVLYLIVFCSDVDCIGSVLFSQFFILNIKELPESELELPLDKWRSYTDALNGGDEISQSKIAGDNLVMGIGSTLVGKIVLGNQVVVGAGAVVTKSFEEDHITIAGIPAKIISHKAII